MIKLSQEKKQRDDAKAKNDKAKELEQQVTEQLKKREPYLDTPLMCT